MKIGELAQQAQSSTEILRCYDTHLERLRFIRNCRSLDMTHDEIRQLLSFIDQPDQDCDPVTHLINEHLTHVDIRIKELIRLRGQLQQLQNACAQADHAHAGGILEQLSHMEPLPDNSTHL